MIADEILGNFESRYFGAGHKRTEYNLKNVCCSSIGEIYQNGTWSEKSGFSLKPHLSTLDGIVLSVMFVEKYMEETYVSMSLDDLFLCGFEIRSGTVPVNELNNICLNLKKQEILNEKINFEVEIEGMLVRLSFKHCREKYSSSNICNKTNGKERQLLKNT